ncbi:MAG: 2-keto-4-methylthiobutyrate aminotransferase [Alphaproteobacteria bacterium RIFOXYD12_FULL_60_8]|nr:MAG: 2-keto-4-methylthiobutyrate aminotransferase [Alphaproteobacteria bacterium RIFOXYD12_FULL_60_8]
MSTVFINGRLVPFEDASIALNDRGFTLGDGVFETLRVRNGVPLRREAHLARLQSGSALLGIPCPTDLSEAMDSVLAANGHGEGVMRLTLTRGPGPRGLLPPDPPHPTVVIAVTPLPPPMPAVRAVIAETTRRNEHSPLCRCKTLNYLDNVLARLEAERHGANEAILLNTEGLLAETTVANLFVVKDGAVLTPRLSDGALPGVLRGVLIPALKARECGLTVEDLLTADEVFVSNSLGVRPVLWVGERQIGDGAEGPITRRAKDIDNY